MIYANNAGTSWPKPDEVVQAVARTLTAAPSESAAVFEQTADAVAELIGLACPDRLLFTPGCTSALAVALLDLPWRAGDVVLTSALEHHAVGGPADRLVRDRGVVHRVAPRAADAAIDLQLVEDVLREGRVRAVVTTAASNVTGELLPVAELARLAHDHDALYVMDAAQTVGVVPVDVDAIGADVVAFAGHKGPLGPQGVGALWSRRGVGFESPWVTCEIGGASDRPACGSDPDYCDVGGANLAGIAGLGAGMRWHLQRPGEIGQEARALADRLVDELEDREGCRVFGGDAFGRTATVSVRIEGLAVERAEEHFAARGVAVRAGAHCAPMALEAIGAPEGTVRISFGPFNRTEDVDAVLAAIDEVGSG